MEKFARQSINDGTTSTEELTVSRDSELFRALNMHYNKANDFEVRACLFLCEHSTISVKTDVNTVWAATLVYHISYRNVYI